MKNYYLEVPNNYRKDFVIDAKNKKTVIIFNVLAILTMFIFAFLLIFLQIGSNGSITFGVPSLFIGFIFLFLYIIFHELTHGLAYKVLTGLKLKFGMTLSVAFCGVPNAYVNKKTALIAILAPFIVYTIILSILLTIYFNYIDIYIILSMIFIMHISGCVGDIYGALVILFRYKNKKILMNDTGPTQTFYVEED